MFLAKRKRRRETTRPTTPRRSFCSRFALSAFALTRFGGLEILRSSRSERRRDHVTEIGCPAGEGVCGNGKAYFTYPRVRGEVEERSDEDEGASPQFRASRGMRQRCRRRRNSAPSGEAPSPHPLPRARGEGDARGAGGVGFDVSMVARCAPRRGMALSSRKNTRKAEREDGGSRRNRCRMDRRSAR